MKTYLQEHREEDAGQSKDCADQQKEPLGRQPEQPSRQELAARRMAARGDELGLGVVGDGTVAPTRRASR